MASTRFAGRVVLITGAAQGMGREHVLRLASEGASVIAFDLPDQIGKIEGIAAELAEDAGPVLAVGGDVRSQRDTDLAVEQALSSFARLDGVVVNAGVVSSGALWELSDEEWNRTIDVNLTGAWRTLKSSIPAMLDGDGGSIVLIGSGGALKGLPFLGHYCASKHGLLGMGQSLAQELGQHRIRVNSVNPSGVKTPMSGVNEGLLDLLNANPGTVGAFRHILPLEPGVEYIEATDVSSLVLYLLSDDAKWITGANIPIDAGQSSA